MDAFYGLETEVNLPLSGPFILISLSPHRDLAVIMENVFRESSPTGQTIQVSESFTQIIAYNTSIKIPQIYGGFLKCGYPVYKSWILTGFSIINHPAIGVPLSWKPRQPRMAIANFAPSQISFMVRRTSESGLVGGLKYFEILLIRCQQCHKPAINMVDLGMIYPWPTLLVGILFGMMITDKYRAWNHGAEMEPGNVTIELGL